MSCRSIIVYWPGSREEEINDALTEGLFTFVRGLCQFLVLASLLVYLRSQSIRAKHGDLGVDAANKSLIFPLYTNLLWVLAASFLLSSAGDLLSPFDTARNGVTSSMMHALAMGLQHFVLEGVAVLLMFPGCGIWSTRRGLSIAATWASITFASQLVVYHWSDTLGAFMVEILWGASLFLFYTFLWLLPLNILRRRPAVRNYAVFWSLTRFVLMVSDILRTYSEESGFCLYIVSPSGVLSVLYPYLVYHVLLRDSQYWRGLVQPAGGRERGSISSPLQDITLGVSSAKAIANQIDVGPSSLDKTSVKVISSGLLEIDNKADGQSAGDQRGQYIVLGAGSASRVFRGRLQGLPCAIKMIFCPEIDPASIQSFYHEASLLSRLKHPNVLEIYGICVMPPSISLVMELCPNGNLYEYLRREPNLSWSTKLRLAQECAASVAFLHAQHPPVLHLDIKSLNFLLTAQNTIKISDLELGQESGPGGQAGFRTPDTVNWLAPEIILQKRFDEKADVYALAMCLWEILTARIPFSDFEKNQPLQAGAGPEEQPARPRFVSAAEKEDRLRHAICHKQYRPPIPADTPEEWAKLLEWGWHHDTEQRCSAKDMHDKLLAMQEDMDQRD